jgi:uridine kinase
MREDRLSAISRISKAIDALERPSVFVAIDGYSGAGKSTLARVLAERRRVTLLHMDDFYRVIDPDVRARLTAREGVDQYFDWQRVRREVLVPLRRGDSARFQRYNWGTNELGSWQDVVPAAVVILEGVYSTRPELVDVMDLRVLVDTPRGVRLERQIARNENNPEWIERWAAAEQLYFDKIMPHDAHDLVVVGHS